MSTIDPTIEKAKETLQKMDKLPSKKKDYSEEDKKFYSAVTKALFSSELDYLLESKKYALAVIIAGSMLDQVGKVKLTWKFKGAISEAEIYRLDFNLVIKLLLASGIIDNRLFQQMEHIRDTRNGIAHYMMSERLALPDHELAAQVRHAKEIIAAILKDP